MGTKTGTRAKPRPDSARVLFGWKPGRPHPHLRGVPRGMARELAPVLDRDRGEVLEDARRYFLHRVRVLRPAVLSTLADVTTGDGLRAWAMRWGLADASTAADHWVCDYATDTLELWREWWPNGRGREWSLNRASEEGKWVPTRGRLPAFKYLEIPRHRFDWLVDLQVHDSERVTFAAVARAHGVDQRAVARGCKELAATLDLPLLPRTRGE